MSSRRLIGALLVSAVLAFVASSAAAAAEGSGISLIEADGARFPDRAFVLSLPSPRYLTPESVIVRENGIQMDRVSVSPAGQAGDAFAFVLVIDASDSMKGQPIASAVEAARAFAARRLPTQRVGIVLFNGTTKTILPLTSDGDAISSALAEPPPLAHGTHIYDGVTTAVGMLEAAHVAAGSIVVLSDGADTGSNASLESVAAESRGSHIRIYSVGLRNKAFQPGPLQDLAEGAGGTFTEVTSAEDLAPVFDALGAKLANEYLIRYRSPAEPRETVHVSIEIVGLDGVATAEYETPAVAGTAVPFHRPLSQRLLLSPLGMLVTSLMCALFVSVAVILMLRPRGRHLRARMAEFVSPPERDAKREATVRRQALLEQAERPLSRAPWWVRFKEDLELAEIKTPAGQIVVATVIGTLCAMWLFATIGGSWVFGVLGLAVPLIPRAIVKRKLRAKREAFAEQLPDNLQVLSSALRAGHSLVGALSVVVDDSPEPARSEFQRVVADEQLGVPLDEALMVVARRMANRDLEQVALVATLQAQTGGNTAEVLDRVGETIRERFELRRLVKTLTTQGRLSRWIVSFLPVGLLGLITLINPAYMAPLYQSSVGRVLLLLAGVMIVTGSLMIRRIVDIEV